MTPSRNDFKTERVSSYITFRGVSILHCQAARLSKPTGRNSLDTTTTCETPDSRLGYTLDVVAKNLSVTLGTTFAKTLAALAT